MKGNEGIWLEPGQGWSYSVTQAPTLSTLPTHGMCTFRTFWHFLGMLAIAGGMPELSGSWVSGKLQVGVRRK
jgi:hypothetical protein